MTAGSDVAAAAWVAVGEVQARAGGLRLEADEESAHIVKVLPARKRRNLYPTLPRPNLQ